MKKLTFILVTVGATAGALFFECSPEYNSENITTAQDKNIITAYEDRPMTDAEIHDHLRKVNPEATSEEIEALIWSNK